MQRKSTRPMVNEMERVELEAMVKEVCPASLWYDLMDCLDETPDEELVRLIAENQHKA